MTTAASLPTVPAELWQQMEITYAADRQDFGRLLKAYRELQSPIVKQAELAAALGITQGQISRIESGKSPVVDLKKLIRWAQAIGIPDSILWFKYPATSGDACTSTCENDKIETTTNGEGEGVDRRQFIKASTTLGSTILSTGAGESRPAVSHAIGSSDVERMHEWTENFRRADNRWGGGHSLKMASGYLSDSVVPMIRETRVSNAVRRELLVESAQLFQLTGWMHYDTSDRQQGHKALRNAFRMACDAKDYALAAEMQAGMSHQASFLRMPDTAQDSALNAKQYAKLSGSTSVQSEAAVMEAHALALQGDLKGTVRALQEADDLAHQIREADTPDWHRYYDHAYRAAKFGHVLRDLGLPDDAERYARDSLNMSEGYERGRAFNLALLAGVLADQGEVDEAMTHAELALQLMTSMRSSRTRGYLNDVAHRLSPYAKHERVQHFFRQLTKRGIPTQRVS